MIQSGLENEIQGQLYFWGQRAAQERPGEAQEQPRATQECGQERPRASKERSQRQDMIQSWLENDERRFLFTAVQV